MLSSKLSRETDETHLPDNVADCHEMIMGMSNQIRQLTHRIKWLSRKIFGSSSEQMRVDPADLTFFGEENFPGLEVELESPKPSDEEEENKTAKTKQRSR